jgi:hypothetical protein
VVQKGPGIPRISFMQACPVAQCGLTAAIKWFTIYQYPKLIKVWDEGSTSAFVALTECKFLMWVIQLHPVTPTPCTGLVRE